MGHLSSFLYAEPSFIEGAARILDFGDTMSEYNRSPTGTDADYVALAADWERIGADLFEAMRIAKIEQARGQTQPAEAK